MRDSRRTRLVLALLLLAAFTLITLDFRGGIASPVTALRNAGNAAFGQIERGAAAMVEPVRNAVRAVADAHSAQERIDALQRENMRLRGQLRSRRMSQQRAAEMDKLLKFAGRGQYRIVAAEVVAVRGALGFEHTATIGVGRQDGVKADMTVVSAQGLVGRIVHAGARTSTVLLAIDGSSHVGARLETSDEIGVVHGGGMGEMQLELLDSKAPVKVDDRLVTFGSQGGTPYVPGVPIGRVVSTQRDPASLLLRARVEPFVDFSSLDLVGVVVQPPDRDPGDAVLPPQPSSTPGQESENQTPDDQGGDSGGDSQQEETAGSALTRGPTAGE